MVHNMPLFNCVAWTYKPWPSASAIVNDSLRPRQVKNSLLYRSHFLSHEVTVQHSLLLPFHWCWTVFLFLLSFFLTSANSCRLHYNFLKLPLSNVNSSSISLLSKPHRNTFILEYMSSQRKLRIQLKSQFGTSLQFFFS